MLHNVGIGKHGIKCVKIIRRHFPQEKAFRFKLYHTFPFLTVYGGQKNIGAAHGFRDVAPIAYLLTYARFKSICYALCEHCVRNLFKACNVSACKQVAFHIVLLCGIVGVVENVYHNILKLCVNLVKRPTVAH